MKHNMTQMEMFCVELLGETNTLYFNCMEPLNIR